ncbi:hypothetical protein CCAX7_64290 [Capsulimonas corticalis]|uniref:Uncharacterized protein n=1 Tax=Capsulimonas corticalis TaxID=2219043 RepID=A0A402CQP0_9BACT|nr:hypothetical protein [Capsulimonas corticalis]BDI34378.1 hypothetical protein CCAX7_64290 [Capsulimonas corticalis]
MRSQVIARFFSVLCLPVVLAAGPALADVSNTNSDMMLSGPSAAEPMRLTIRHPKNTSVHLTIITDASSGGSVEFSAPKNADPTIAYSFPSNDARNIRVIDGRGSEIWSLLDGQVSVGAGDADADLSHTVLTQLDRAYSILPVALQGVYTLHPNAAPEFLATTDFVRTDPAGAGRQWAHRQRHVPLSSSDKSPSATTIVIGPSRYIPEPERRHPAMQ